jgi:chromosome segregation ATPase
LLLVLLAIVLWVKWAESRNRAALLETEIRQIRAEAEAARARSTREQGRLAGLEREIQTLRAERDRVLQRLEGLEAQLLKGAARPDRGGPSR